MDSENPFEEFGEEDPDFDEAKSILLGQVKELDYSKFSPGRKKAIAKAGVDTFTLDLCYEKLEGVRQYEVDASLSVIYPGLETAEFSSYEDLLVYIRPEVMEELIATLPKYYRRKIAGTLAWGKIEDMQKNCRDFCVKNRIWMGRASSQDASRN